MVFIRIPGTNKIVAVPRHTGDYVFDYQNAVGEDASITQESVPVVGGWTDYTGSGGTGPTATMLQGIQDSASKTPEEKALDVQYATAYDDRGQRATTHRSRTKLITIEVPNE